MILDLFMSRCLKIDGILISNLIYLNSLFVIFVIIYNNRHTFIWFCTIIKTRLNSRGQTEQIILNKTYCGLISEDKKESKTKVSFCIIWFYRVN